MRLRSKGNTKSGGLAHLREATHVGRHLCRGRPVVWVTPTERVRVLWGKQRLGLCKCVCNRHRIDADQSDHDHLDGSKLREDAFPNHY